MNKSQKKEKILACFSHVNQKSAARMNGVSQAYVCDIWASAGLLYQRRNQY